MLDKSSEEVPGMYLICIYHGETLQWPLAYHDDTSDYEDGWQEYHSKYFCFLLLVPESGHAILPSQLTGISSLAQVVFEVKREYGHCCLLFKMGDPTHFVPLGMTYIGVFGSIVCTGPQS